MAWQVRLYVPQIDPVLERLWAEHGIRICGFGQNTVDGRGPWYSVRYDQREVADRLLQQLYARPTPPPARRWWHIFTRR